MSKLRETEERVTPKLIANINTSPRADERRPERLSVVEAEPVAGFQMERMELEPRARLGGTPHLGGTREFFTCVSGEITLSVGTDAHVLKPGDVLAFPGDQPHAYQNSGPGRAVGISLVALAST